MNWLAAMIRRVQLFAHYTVDDILNAENEDALRDHKAVVDEVTSATAARRLSNGKLRESLREAQIRSTTLNDIEKNIRHAARRAKRALNTPNRSDD